MDYSIEMDLTKKSRGGHQVLREPTMIRGRCLFVHGEVPPLHGVGYVGQSSSGSMRPPYSVRATWRILSDRSDVRRPARALDTVPTLTPNTLASLRPAPNGRMIFSIFFILFGRLRKNPYIWSVKTVFTGANIRTIQISSNFFGRKM